MALHLQECLLTKCGCCKYVTYVNLSLVFNLESLCASSKVPFGRSLAIYLLSLTVILLWLGLCICSFIRKIHRPKFYVSTYWCIPFIVKRENNNRKKMIVWRVHHWRCGLFCSQCSSFWAKPMRIRNGEMVFFEELMRSRVHKLYCLFPSCISHSFLGLLW